VSFLIKKSIKTLAMRKISDAEKEAIVLEIELSKLRRSRATLVLAMGILMYFVFIMAAVIGFVNKLINQSLLNVMVVMGLAVLIVALLPYMKTVNDEERQLDSMISELFS
jgi:cytochrome c biogenesis protein CcdA